MSHHRRLLAAVVLAATATAGLVALPEQAQAQVNVVASTPAGATTIATTMAAPGTTVTGASFPQAPPTQFTPNGTANSTYAGFPTNGAGFGILTTGNVTAVSRTNFRASFNDQTAPTAARGNTAYDASVLKVDLGVPPGANCLTFDFKFLSEEYSAFVGQTYNDGFVAELDSSTWKTNNSAITAPDNFAFDGAGRVVSVNSSGIGGMSAANGTGTTYDYGTDASSNGTNGGATGLLKASTRVTPGAHSVYFSIFDQGDFSYDSAVFLDNLRVGYVADPATNCSAGTQVASYQLGLTPMTGTSPTGTPHPVTATLKDADGRPVAGAPVSFTVAGANPGTGTATTDAAGVATYSYSGTAAGADAISACYQPAGVPACLANGSATMNWQKVVTITADNYTVSYGAPSPSFTYTTGGLDGSDTLITQPSCAVTGPHSTPGTYPITCTGGAVDPKYVLKYAPGTLTVTPAAVTVTADNQTTTYGDPDPAFTSTTSGLIGSDALVTRPTCGVQGPHSDAGSYDITCTGADPGGNYSTAYVAGKLTVKKAALVVTAENRTKVYGDHEPAYPATTAGLLGDDALVTRPVCDVAGPHAGVGDYDITCTGADAGGNYTVSYVPGTLTVTRAAAVVTADNKAQVYGDAEPAYTWTTTGLVGDDALVTEPVCDVAGAHSAVGDHTITCTGASAGPNYTTSTVPGTLTVTRAKATISADNKTITYGDADPAFTFTPGGTLGPDTLSSTPTCDVAGQHSDAGTYDITCTGPATDGNYEIAYLAGTLTVKKAVVTITAANRTVFYGDAEPGYGSTVSGLIGSDQLTTPATCGVAGAHRDAGSYDITCAEAGAGGNYTVSYLPGTLTVKPVAVTVTADNKSIVFGQAEPAYTWTANGLIGSDALTTAPACGVAGSHRSAGSYDITCGGAGAGGNYTISYVKGTLTVAKAPTALRMTPLLLELFRPTAVLTRADTGAPVAGQTVTFGAASSVVCSAVTNSKGVARCSNTLLITFFVPATATYAGSGDYTGSRDSVTWLF